MLHYTDGFRWRKPRRRLQRFRPLANGSIDLSAATLEIATWTLQPRCRDLEMVGAATWLRDHCMDASPWRRDGIAERCLDNPLL